MSPSDLRWLADHIGDPILGLGLDGTARFANKSAKRLLGADIESQSLAALTTDPEAFRRFLTRASRSATPIPGAARFSGDPRRWYCRCGAARRGSEAVLILQLRSSELQNESFLALKNQLTQLRKVMAQREQTEREQAEQLAREQALRKQAEEASQARDQLLAAVSHELRTPLQAIAGWVTLIRSSPEDRATLKRGLDVIERNVAAEVQLTEDLVDTALLVSGKMRLELQRVDLAEVIHDVVENLQPTARQKQITIESVAQTEQCIVNGDPGRLRQVLWNLLSNAIKYTPKQGWTRVALAQVNSHVEIAIEDSGEGIAPTVLPHVFDAFQRADGSTTRRHGGLGLGLAIVRHLVELHGGLVFVESTEHGSTFTVNLPLPAFEKDGHPLLEGQATEDQALEGVHVLLVEDHDDSREILATILKAGGATVATAEDANQARTQFDARLPDVIVSDIEMPNEDGLTLMRKLREIERDRCVPAVPALALSAHRFRNASQHAERAGFNAFMSKPVRPTEFIAQLRRLLDAAISPESADA